MRIFGVCGMLIRFSKQYTTRELENIEFDFSQNDKVTHVRLRLCECTRRAQDTSQIMCSFRPIARHALQLFSESATRLHSKIISGFNDVYFILFYDYWCQIFIHLNSPNWLFVAMLRSARIISFPLYFFIRLKCDMLSYCPSSFSLRMPFPFLISKSNTNNKPHHN